VRVNHMSNHLCNVLIDEYDVDVIPFDEPLERFFNLAHAGAFVDDHEVWLAILS